MPGTGSLPQAETPYGVFAVVFGAALVLSLLLTPLARTLGEKWGIVAEPGPRRRHAGRVSKLGGAAVYVAFVAAVILSQQFVYNPAEWASLPDAWHILRFDQKEIVRLGGLLLSTTVIMIAGLLDDWLELPPLPLYVVQVLAGGIAIGAWIFIEYVNNPLTGQQTPDFPYLVTISVTLFWLGLMTNTVNWLDGLDGLAAGVVVIACLVLFINAAFRLEPAQYSVAVLPLALGGAALGFLPYNFASKVFLGSGAYFLGFALGTLSIIGGAKMAAILLVMGLPLLDVAWQIVSRVLRGQNPASGDRGHLHFRLADLGVSQRKIVLGYYVFCALFGGLALMIPSRLYKLIALGVLGLICLAAFAWLARLTPVPQPEPPEASPHEV